MAFLGFLGKGRFGYHKFFFLSSVRVWFFSAKICNIKERKVELYGKYFAESVSYTLGGGKKEILV